MDMIIAPFNNRVPLSDPIKEEERIAEYWDWLNSNLSKIKETARKLETLSKDEDRDKRLVRLESIEDADYEAAYLNHSIGFNWNKYSKLGEVYSIRAIILNHEPEATVLVVDNKVVHAREACNARLSASNEMALEKFCEDMGWTIVPDLHPIDIFQGDGPNTSITYCSRHNGNEKTVASVVLPGRVDDLLLDRICYIADRCGNLINLQDLGLPRKTRFRNHEIIAIKNSFDEAEVSIGIADFADTWAKRFGLTLDIMPSSGLSYLKTRLK